MSTSLPDRPLSAYETYLASIAGQDVTMPDRPLDRIQQYLAYIAENGGTGGGGGGGGGSGEPGHSITVETQETDSGTALTFKDATTGATISTAFIYNGSDGATGSQGPQGEKGEPFAIAKTYSSVSEMNADFANTNVPKGSFVMISDEDSEDNGKLYIKNETAFAYVTNMSGVQGIKGDPGANGENGHSITVESETLSSGVQLTFKDAVDGTTLANAFIANGLTGPQGETGPRGAAGKDGKDGITPVKGTDYWTDEDKSSIVDDVLASIQNGEEMTF